MEPQKYNHVVRHIHWLECYPDTTVGKAGPSPIIYICPDFQPEMLHRILQRLYIFTFLRVRHSCNLLTAN